jgi:hypothetical protein
MMPEKLRRLVPPMIYIFLEQRRFWTYFGTAFAALSVNGPIIGPPDHNALRYLFAPLICPCLCAIYFSLVPFNPYRGLGAQFGGFVNKDLQNEDAKRLVDVYRSMSARREIWRSALTTSGILLLLLLIAAAVEWRTLRWSLNSPWLVPGLMGCVIASFIAVGTRYISWGLERWGSGAPT